MKELIFSIENIFKTDSQEGCLPQYDSKMYHIPAYQRGYKWGSDENGAVTILLSDLWDAYQAFANQERSEYYLQYVTVKKSNVQINAHAADCLEVIDGQQRLTSLSILLSVFSFILDKPNISQNKLHYAIRDNFFSDHIYPKESLKDLIGKEWNDLEHDSNFNKQDIYYLFSAVKRINSFLSEIEEEYHEKFYDYILENVKLIVNSVESHIQSETVFKNLNSNKVPLTEAELIKGLLITKVGRQDKKEKKNNFKEILELRTNIGRQWDEISRWANNPIIRGFFFNNKNGMHQLLLLTAKRLHESFTIKTDTKETNYSLFNFYHKYGKADQVFQLLKDTQATLNDWFVNTEIYNHLGFCRFSKDSNFNKLDDLTTLLGFSNKELLIEELEERKEKLLNSEKEYKDLRYGEDDKQIHAILLALSVFVEGQEIKFDFFEFERKKWSLEHIFPQSPEGKDKVLMDSEKIQIRNMLGENITDEVENVLELETRNEEQKQIYYKALQEQEHLNSIGNMCLLTTSDNSSNGCLFFKDKRNNILKLIQKGSFVPKHTFDVFSKMISNLKNSDLGIWNKDDIEQHREYIQNQFS